ncbi:MAG: hypothetical protein WCU00_06980 [Candidatus Latescibacterota bacterium]
MNVSSIISIILPILFFSCSSDDTVNDRNEFANKNSRVSECGGFTSASKTAADPDTSSTEKLVWSYDKETRTLSLLNKRVSLNCCGAHSISAVRDGSDIVIKENDQPLDTGRCKCMCLFDFATEIEGLSEDAVSLRLELTVDSTLFNKWSGTISLTGGGSEITIPRYKKTL